jgi:hypothetical protein
VAERLKAVLDELPQLFGIIDNENRELRRHCGCVISDA